MSITEEEEIINKPARTEKQREYIRNYMKQRYEKIGNVKVNCEICGKLESKSAMSRHKLTNTCRDINAISVNTFNNDIDVIIKHLLEMKMNNNNKMF